MRKIFTLFVAALCCATILMPQKASAVESYGTFWVGDVEYYFEVNGDFHYATLSAFKLEVTGHVVIPETFDFDAGDGIQTWTVTGVNNAFGVHSNVSSVDLPGTIMSVSDQSFINSLKLERVIIRANVPPVVYNNDWQEVSDTKLFNAMAFEGLYVPNAVVQDYENDSNWGKSEIYPITEFQAIENIATPSDKARKVMMDGTLYIAMPDGKIYNATGVQVK